MKNIKCILVLSFFIFLCGCTENENDKLFKNTAINLGKKMAEFAKLSPLLENKNKNNKQEYIRYTQPYKDYINDKSQELDMIFDNLKKIISYNNKWSDDALFLETYSYCQFGLRSLNNIYEEKALKKIDDFLMLPSVEVEDWTKNNFNNNMWGAIKKEYFSPELDDKKNLELYFKFYKAFILYIKKDYKASEIIFASLIETTKHGNIHNTSKGYLSIIRREKGTASP